MLMKWLIVLLVAAGPQSAPQLDVFKKDMVPLQSAVDSLVTSTGAQVTPSGRSHAAYIEGYGVIVTLEIAFEAPQAYSIHLKNQPRFEHWLPSARKK